jgi:hypothetical protein
MGNTPLEGVKGKYIPVQASTVPAGSWSLKLSGFLLDSWHMIAARLSAYVLAAFSSPPFQEKLLVFLSVRG